MSADDLTDRIADDDDVARALHAAHTQSAGHWPTVAAVLADEVDRLRQDAAANAAAVARVRALADEDNPDDGAIDRLWRRRIRRALDGEATP